MRWKITGGSGPVTGVTWSGTNIPSGTVLPNNGNNEFSKIYTTVGTKTITGTITEAYNQGGTIVSQTKACTAQTTVKLDTGAGSGEI
jgi:hypothetical protein